MKETLEKNKLIAEFLKWDKHGDTQMFQVPNLYPIYHKEDERQTGWMAEYPENFNFHDRWDWLMPAYQIFHPIAEDRLGMDWKSISFCSEFVSGVVTGNIQRSFNALYNGINWYTLSQGEKQL